MHSKKAKICKFNLFKKCKFGNECNFRHINVDDFDQILNEILCLKAENDMLKNEVKQMNKTLTVSKKIKSAVTSNEVHALEKRLYSSFFKNNQNKSPTEPERKSEKVVTFQSECSDIDDDVVDRKPIKEAYKPTSSKKKCSDKRVKSTLGDVFEENKVKKHEEYVVTLINNISKLEERLNCVETQLNCLNKNTSLNQITVLDEIRSPTMLCPYDSDNDSDEEIVSIEFRYLQHQKDLPSTGPGLVKYDPNYDYKNCKFKSL